MEKKLKVGIYGLNGHQISGLLKEHKRCDFIAYAGVPEDYMEDYDQYINGTLKFYNSLDEMIEKSGVEFVCICSPRRIEQVEDAIKLLNAGINVYSEKPAAFTEEQLEKILEAEKNSTAEFHEIADTMFFEPYMTMSKLIKEGAIGEVVQVYAQKSYKGYLETRPEDVNKDGGITRWVGIHAARFIEHVCGVKIKDVSAYETTNGAAKENPKVVTASSISMSLENGGVAAMNVNYFNPLSFPLHGNESIRAFGTKGVIEITDGGLRTHLWNDKGDLGEFASIEDKTKSFFDYLIDHLLDGEPMPFDSETELHPLRAVIRMKESADRNK